MKSMVNKSTAKKHLLSALIINAVFMAAVLLTLRPYYETMDDFILQQFIDGQLGMKSAHLLYVNIVLSEVLKLLYNILPMVPWYALMQYAIIFCALTGVTWVLLERMKNAPAILLSLMFLCVFGLDAYIRIQFSKTTALATVGGLLLMYSAMDCDDWRVKYNPIMMCGIILALMGSMYRHRMFISVGFFMALLVIDPLMHQLRLKPDDLKEKLTQLVHIFSPFALLLALFAVLHMFDMSVYSVGEWKDYKDYNDARAAVMNYYVPPYEENEELYGKLGIPESFVKLMAEGEIFDPDLLNEENLETIQELGTDSLRKLWLSSNDFVGECVRTLTASWCFAGLAIAALIWLVFGRHDLSAWLSIIPSILLLLGFEIYSCSSGRVDFAQVNYCYVLAMTGVFLWYIPKKNGSANVLCSAAIVLLCILFIGRSALFGMDKFMEGSKDRSTEREILSELSQEDYVMVADMSLYRLYRAYSPFETTQQMGLWDNVIPLGGWQTNSPPILKIMNRSEIGNPFRDIVDSSTVCLVSDHAEEILDYIKDEYVPGAKLEKLRDLGEESGIAMYMIKTK